MEKRHTIIGWNENMMTRIRTGWTATLASEVDNKTQLRMIGKALSKLEGAVDLVIFDPNVTEESSEDGGMTARVPWAGLVEKVYARIDVIDEEGNNRVLMFYKASEN